MLGVCCVCGFCRLICLWEIGYRGLGLVVGSSGATSVTSTQVPKYISSASGCLAYLATYLSTYSSLGYLVSRGSSEVEMLISLSMGFSLLCCEQLNSTGDSNSSKV